MDYEKKDRYRLRPQFLPPVYFLTMTLDCYLVTLAVLPQFCICNLVKCGSVATALP